MNSERTRARRAIAAVAAGVACVAALSGGVVASASADVAPPPPTAPAAERASIPGTPASGSRPGAPVTIYLDFDGEVLTGRNWNKEAGAARLDFKPSAMATPQAIHDVWAAVAEDYAPFNINVTTTRPSDARLYKTSADDREYGVHAIITDSDIVPDKAFTSGFGWINAVGSNYYEGAIVNPLTIGGGDATRASAKAVADAVSHEVGHNFGLNHQGINDGSGLKEYYGPYNSLWGPIMGEGALTPVSQWTRGDYAGADHKQDDVATITDRSIQKTISYDLVTADGKSYAGALCPLGDANLANPKPGDRFQKIGAKGTCDGTGAALTPLFTYVDRADYAKDEVGNDAAHAKALTLDKGRASVHGVIERQNDVDVFRVDAGDGELKARVAVAAFSPDLDAKLVLTDASGKVIAENDPPAKRLSDDIASGLGAAVSAQVKAGVYYLSVDGVGTGDPSKATLTDAHGYSDYGSLGNYQLSVSAAPTVTPTASETPAAPSAGPSSGPSAGPATGPVSFDGTTLLILIGGAVSVALVILIVIVLIRAARARHD